MKLLNKFPIVPILFLLFITFWSVKPLTDRGFYPTHDDTAPSRIYLMAKEIRALQLPVRWVSDLGYGFGYPLFNFYAPLPYYTGSIFNLAGMDAVDSAKMMFLLAVFLSGISMYLLMREMAGDLAGLASGVLYVYAPYHAVNTYVRGAAGELYAYAFLPFFILGILRFFKGKINKATVSLVSLSLAAILLSHNIMGMLVLYFLILGLTVYLFLLFLRGGKFRSFYYLLVLILLGIGLSAFFTVPAFLEKKYTKVESLTSGGSDFRNHFVYPDQLWNSPWGFAGSAAGRNDGMSFKIGKIHLILGLLSIVAVIYLYRNKRLDGFQVILLNMLASVFFLSVLLMLNVSKFIWELLPGFSYIQYPWRFLNFTIVALAILPYFIFHALKTKYKLIASAVIIISIVLINQKYFVPKFQADVKEQEYTSKSNLRWKISGISDEYMPANFTAPVSEAEVASQSISETEGLILKDFAESSVRKSYLLEASDPIRLITNIAYFPGWQGAVNGSGVTLYDSGGRISLDLDIGDNKIDLIFKNTPVRTVANAISISSLFLLVYVSLFEAEKLYGRKRNGRNSNSDI